MNQTQQTPQRMCIICRQRFAKNTLKRFVCFRQTENKASLTHDSSQKLPGRGYYICMDEACQKKFNLSRGWQKKCKGGK